MNMIKRVFYILMVLSVTTLISACSLQNVMGTADDVKNQVADVSKAEITKQLQNSLQEKIDKLKQTQKSIIGKDGKLNWKELKKTSIAEYVFFSALGYEYKAVLKGDGTVEIIRMNSNTGEKKVYATYKVLFENGNIKLQ